MSRKGDGITTPKGLEGKKYATWDLPIEKAIIKNVVEKDGGDFSKVELVPSTVTDEVSALSTKQIDAVWVYYGWAGIAANVKNFEFDYFAFKDINPTFDYYTPVIITNDDMIKNIPSRSFWTLLKRDMSLRQAILRMRRKSYLNMRLRLTQSLQTRHRSTCPLAILIRMFLGDISTVRDGKTSIDG